MADAREWIALLKKEALELRRLGILSIGCDGNSATLAPSSPADDDKPSDKPDGGTQVGEDVEEVPSNAWENPASYPTGSVPTLGDVDPVDKLPEIPRFGDD